LLASKKVEKQTVDEEGDDFAFFVRFLEERSWMLAAASAVVGGGGVGEGVASTVPPIAARPAAVSGGVTALAASSKLSSEPRRLSELLIMSLFF
jgi:hypothetical protein